MGGRSGLNYGPGDYNMKGMNSMHQSGLGDPNNNLMGGAKTLQESSGSDSESSNSSAGSNNGMLANPLNKKSFSHVPNAEGMNE